MPIYENTYMTLYGSKQKLLVNHITHLRLKLISECRQLDYFTKFTKMFFT